MAREQWAVMDWKCFVRHEAAPFKLSRAFQHAEIKEDPWRTVHDIIVAHSAPASELRAETMPAMMNLRSYDQEAAHTHTHAMA